MQSPVRAAAAELQDAVVQTSPTVEIPDLAAEPPVATVEQLHASPTPVLVELEGLPDLEQPSAPTDFPAAPLDFAFPAAGPEPISLWRPPLYPTPWEPSPQDHFYLTRPVGADEVNWPLARYRYGYLFYSEPHTGIDIPAPRGTPILAAGSGTVIHAGYGLYFLNDPYRDPYGIAVAIKHDFGYGGQMIYTVYGHMDEVFVYRGQKVEAGEAIGVIGMTGNTSGPHVHLEVRLGDTTFFGTRNPELWISPPQGWGVLVGSVTEAGGRKLPKVKAKIVRQETQQIFEAVTYAQGSLNSNSYYDENLVLGDLLPGRYSLLLEHNQVIYKTDDLVIQPGQVSYFHFRLGGGFDFTRPPVKGADFIPPDSSIAP